MERARGVAHADGVTFRELVEEGLLLALRQRESMARKPLKPVTVKGRGLQEAFRNGGWEEIRNAAYRGHGT